MVHQALWEVDHGRLQELAQLQPRVQVSKLARRIDQEEWRGSRWVEIRSSEGE